MIANLIETGSNFDVVLDLIQNSNELLDTNLGTLNVAKVYRERLKEYTFKCKKRMETECLTLIEA